MYDLVGDQYVYSDAFGWLNWSGTHWRKETAEARLQTDVTEILKARRIEAAKADLEGLVKAAKPTAAKVKSAIYLFQAMVTVAASYFNDAPNLLNVANGVIDLRTGKLTPHTKVNRFTYCVPVEYDPNATALEWEKTVQDIFNGDGDMIRFLQQALGYAITGETEEECMFYLYGPRGRNGKGTICNTVLEMLGEPVARATSFDTFSDNKRTDPQGFLLAPLRNARFIVAGESGKKKLNEAVVKNSTGNDTLQVAFKGKTPFSMKPQFKVFLLSNHQIMGDVDDDAFWGRVNLILFPNHYGENPDTKLKARLRKEYPGILAWLVRGAQDWYANGLIVPAQSKLQAQQHRDDLDTVKRFIQDELIEAPGKYVSLDKVYSLYQDFMEGEGAKPMPKNWLTRTMRKKGVEIKRKTINGIKMRIVCDYTTVSDNDTRF